MGRKPLYITAGRGVTDPLTGAGFSVTISVVESYILRLLGIIHRTSLILGPAREYGVWIVGARHKVGLLLEC